MIFDLIAGLPSQRGRSSMSRGWVGQQRIVIASLLEEIEWLKGRVRSLERICLVEGPIVTLEYLRDRIDVLEKDRDEIRKNWNAVFPIKEEQCE